MDAYKKKLEVIVFSLHYFDHLYRINNDIDHILLNFIKVKKNKKH